MSCLFALLVFGTYLFDSCSCLNLVCDYFIRETINNFNFALFFFSFQEVMLLLTIAHDHSYRFLLFFKIGFLLCSFCGIDHGSLVTGSGSCEDLLALHWVDNFLCVHNSLTVKWQWRQQQSNRVHCFAMLDGFCLPQSNHFLHRIFYDRRIC